MSFHITVTNTEDGSVLIDTDTSCLIGALDRDAAATQSFVQTRCTAVELAAAATGAIMAAYNSMMSLPAKLRRKVKKVTRKEIRAIKANKNN